MNGLLRWAAITFLMMALPTPLVSAHDGQPPAPHDLWSAWNWEPAIALGLGLAAWAYARGLRALGRRGEIRQAARGWRLASFLAGLGVLFIALMSPLDALASALFSAHMLQHVLLILVAAPLLILGVPLGPFLLALSSPVRRTMGRGWRQTAWPRLSWQALTQPLVVWALHAVALWAWHAPGLYQAALRSELVHLLEHFSFLGTALLFWWVLRGAGSGSGFGVLYLFTLALQSGLLGALITFAPRPWYLAYRATAPAWGLTPLEDQQLAGVLMWIPMGVVYTIAALILFAAQLASIERAAQQRERQAMGKAWNNS
jgi:cytochrome c oxidase assembly factor CtaG